MTSPPPPPPPPRSYYRDLASAASRRAVHLSRRYDRLAIVRLLLIVVWVAGFIGLVSTDYRYGIGYLLVTLPLLAFGIRWHLAIGRAAERQRIRHELAEAELRSLSHDFGHWPNGSTYADPLHPYAVDLDLFGRHSVFQLINRTVTAIGSRRLADHLLYADPLPVVARRREAGRALAQDPDWCLEFRTLGYDLNDAPDYARRLLAWVERPALITDTFSRMMRYLAPVLSLVGGWFCVTQQPWQVGLLFFVPAFIALRRHSAAATEEHAYTAQAGKLLGRYRDLLAHLETRQPLSPPAAAAIGRLAYASSQLDVRYNPFVFLLEITGLWSIQWLYRLDRWREAHRHDLAGWLDTLAETDALVSWASLRFHQPSWTEAEFSEERRLTATGLGHPLLPPEGRITNDVTLSTDGQIHLVTGSNMAGKSTWLRTVGVNLVLARAGGPVCGSHLRSRPLQVWTSMRTQDDLSENTSSFFAELKRLKAIIEAVKDPEQEVFFLLDEILKGTNSRDRHTGARALIRQLIRERGAGIIATHDLELAALEDEPGSRVENYAMEVQTRGGELVFDYKLHRGVSQSFNATALMARMGIEIDPADIKLTHD